MSKEEQKQRFLERINLPEKNWKFSAGDAKERAFWDDYMNALQRGDAGDIYKKDSPWYVIPADKKWFTRLAVSEIIVEKLESKTGISGCQTDAHKAELAESKAILEAEK